MRVTSFYGERLPPAALSSYVSCFWHFRSRRERVEFLHTVPPDGCLSLFYRKSSGWLGLTGPTTRPLRVMLGPEPSMFFGVRFWPGASGPLLGLWPSAWREHAGPVASEPWRDSVVVALEGAATEEHAALEWERALSERLPTCEPLDQQACRAAFQLIRTIGSTSVSELALSVGLSERHLRRRFRRAVGLSPKEFARVRRVRASLLTDVLCAREGETSDLGPSWVDHALQHGFSDQSHLVNEFRSIVGLTPPELSRYLRSIEHRFAVDRGSGGIFVS